MDSLRPPRSPSARLFRFLARLVLVAWIGALAGCASGKRSDSATAPEPEPLERPVLSESNQKLARGSLAAVVVTGQSRITVTETIESVFTGAGLQLAGREGDVLVFERAATRKEAAAYGSWSESDSRIRLKVQVLQEGTEQFFLCCRSYVARAAGTGVEDEQSLARRKVRNYEPLLYEVATRLN